MLAAAARAPGLKVPACGLLGENAKRWCRPCAANHPGSVSIGKKCEDCGLKAPSFGLPTEKKMRWCSACSKRHEGAVKYHNRNRCVAGLRSINSCRPTPAHRAPIKTLRVLTRSLQAIFGQIYHHPPAPPFGMPAS
eukprot:SAG31_NODE_21384_length_551_cov_0.787611_2_plen_135_part_01